MTDQAHGRGFRRVLEAIVLALMASLAIVVVLGIGFRKFGAALVWYDEVASVLLAWLTYYGAALAALDRRHIGVPTLVDALPPRAKVVLLVVAEVVVLGFFGAVAWAGVRVLQVLAGTTMISLPWVPTAVTQSVIPIGALLFIVARLLSFPGVLARARRGEALGAHKVPDQIDDAAEAIPEAPGQATS